MRSAQQRVAALEQELLRALEVQGENTDQLVAMGMLEMQCVQLQAEQEHRAAK